MTLVAGIDPGSTGAVALLEGLEGFGELVDTNDGGALAEILRAHKPAAVVLERVAAMPRQGVASTFKFGAAFGTARGVVQALGIPLHYVTPAVWYSHAMKGRPRPKDKKAKKAAVLQAARERWPSASLDRVKDGAIAEALFMADWLRQELAPAL